MGFRRVRIAPLGISALAAGHPDDPLVLCLHGFPDVPQTWEPLMAHLASCGHRVVAPWMRGYAPSTLSGPFHLDRLAEDVLGLADALSPARPVRLVGHDWGAAVSYAALAREPARVDRAVTMSVPHVLAFLAYLARSPRQMRRSWYMGFFQLGPIADGIARARDYALIERLWRDWSPGFTPPRAHLDAIARCFDASWPNPVRYYRAMIRSLATAPRASGRVVRELSRPSQVPLLYLHGADDGCIGASAVEGAAAQAPVGGGAGR